MTNTESSPSGNGGLRFARDFMQGNYFYVLSALLMMLGCWLLMRSPIIGGTVFYRTLKTLLILQGYELLVIATAVIIVVKLLRLGDAFTLFAIEAALLLDPTFFSNSFHTMVHIGVPPMQAVGVNVVCFILVPLKLLILQKALQIKLTPRMFIAFIFAAFLTFLAEFPLTKPNPHYYYYFLGWMPVILAALLPALEKMATIGGEASDFATESQKKRLPRLLLFLPMAIVAAHFIESSQVYGIRFYWLYGAPLLIALGVLIATNIKPIKADEFIYLIDLLCFIALMISIGPLNVGGKAAIHHLVEKTPALIARKIPIMVCALGIALLYLYYYFRHRYKPALFRIAILFLLGFAYGVIHLGALHFIAKIVQIIGNALWLPTKWFLDNPTLIFILLGLIAWAIAIKFRNFGSFFMAGILTLSVIFARLPIRQINWIGEFMQVLFLYVIIIGVVFKQPASLYNVCAFFLAIIGFFRFSQTGEAWAGCLAGLEAASLLFAGIRLKQTGFAVIGALDGVALIILLGRGARGFIPLPLLMIFAALLLFAFGIYVTFRKKEIVAWFDSRIKEPPPRDSLLPPAPGKIAPPTEDVSAMIELPPRHQKRP